MKLTREELSKAYAKMLGGYGVSPLQAEGFISVRDHIKALEAEKRELPALLDIHAPGILRDMVLKDDAKREIVMEKDK